MKAQTKSVLESFFSEAPLESAMPDLLPRSPAGVEISEEITTLDPTLQAAIWLYVDDLDASHTVSQGIYTEEGSFWHGIMHRREGNFSNAKYWFRRAGSLPSRLGLDPIALTDEVERHHRDNPPHLVEAQRREWKTLFEHCARHTE